MNPITKSSGNVFRDLGLPDADARLAKAKLVLKIADIIERRGLNQSEAAAILGIHQPQVSQLLRGRIEGYTIERLLRFLTALDEDVMITTRQKPKGRDRATVRVA